jgi:hypothetical protein
VITVDREAVARAVVPFAARFSRDDMQRAADTWGANCGPAALAAVTQRTLDQVRRHLGDFEQKRYTNPSLMWAALRSLGICWFGTNPLRWPMHGLARVQWEGPWTAPGVPIVARYRHTHWVGSRATDTGTLIFDANCMCVGGWVPLEEWTKEVVPWLLRECERGANGKWHLANCVEVRL